MVAIIRIRALGGSLAVTIPNEIVKKQRLKEDEVVEIEIKKYRQNYFGALKGIGSYKREDRMQDRE